MEINNKRRQWGSDDYCRKPGQSVSSGFPAAVEKQSVHRVDGGTSGRRAAPEGRIISLRSIVS